MSATDARRVLADAMGLPPPPVDLSLPETLGLDVVWRALAEPSVEHTVDALSDARLWRGAALLALVILVPWIALMLYRATAQASYLEH